MDLSVIITAYNVEKQIVECLDSVKNQNIKNAEFIIINDGSTDNTQKMIENYMNENRDSRFITINKNNTGPADVRNYGISKAKGKYLMFIDADDFLNKEKDLLSELINEMNKNNLDLLEFNFDYVNKDKIQKKAINLSNSQIQSGKSLYLREINATGEFWFTVWHFIYKKELIVNNKIYFKKDSIAEDNMWTPIVLSYAQKAKFIDKKIYFYNYSKHSISHDIKNLRKKAFDSIYTAEYLEKHTFFDGNKKFKEKLEQFISKLYIGSIMQLIVINEDKFKRVDIINFLFGKSISAKDYIKLMIILLPKKIRRYLCKVILSHSI